MASVRKEIVVNVGPELVWAAIRDLDGLHRLVPGVVADTKLEPMTEPGAPAVRIVTFKSGLVLRERIVDVDEGERRIAVTATGGRIAHHNSWMQVFADGPGRSRVTWGCDFLPDLLKDTVAAIATQVLAETKANLEKE